MPIGILELQREMKKLHGMTQPEVSSNLDYLIQVGWVREVKIERKFKTGQMELNRQQIKYKISDVGINHMEAGTVFKKSDSSKNINITNIKGVTVVGDGNIVNSEFTDVSRALDELESAISSSMDLTDEQKLDSIGDLLTIRTQIAKKNPDRNIIETAWKSLERIATAASVSEIVIRVGQVLAPFFS